jgi:hypothetical protein
MMKRAATHANLHDAITLFYGDDDVEPSDIWVDDGDAFWHPDTIAPSYSVTRCCPPEGTQELRRSREGADAIF